MSLGTSTLKNWIRENPEQCPSAKVVAVQHGLNIDSVRKEFHRKEGITFGRFISDVRFEHVKGLLLTTELNCFEIATKLKLRDDVLARWFRQRGGCTMEEFRRKNGKAKSPGGGQNLNENDTMSEIANHYCKPKLQREFCCMSTGKAVRFSEKSQSHSS